MLKYLCALILLSCGLEGGITRIRGGASNINYRLQVGQDDLFMRIAPKEQESYFANLQIEYEVLKGLEPFGISPKPVFFDQENKILVTNYIPHNQERVNLLDRTMRRKVMKIIHDIEASNVVISRSFKPYECTMHLAALVGDEYLQSFGAEFGHALQNIDMILGQNPKKTLCHLDLHGLNMLQTEEKLWIIDWEYAMMSHPFLVIASMASIERWDDEEMKRLLEDYMGNYTESDFQLLYLYRIAIDLFWTAWNELQTRTSHIDMPYPVWRQLFEDAARARINSEYCKNLLEKT